MRDNMINAVFVDCTPELRKVIVDERLVVPETVRVYEENPALERLIAMETGAEVLIVEHTVIPPEALDACPSVRAIVFMGTGVGTYVDLEDAKRRGVAIRTTPGYGDRAVAEHALALLFCASRKIVEIDQDIRQGVWRPIGGMQLQGLKLAVVGMGGIGTCMADMGSALGMRVSGWNRTPRLHPAYVSTLDEALSDADAVSIHLGLNADTTALLNARRLRLPKRGYILVNTARAQVVDQGALLAGLDDGHIGHAALDVFPDEPLASGNPYAARPNTTLTAHVAYMTDAAYAELWRRTVAAYQDVRQALNQS